MILIYTDEFIHRTSTSLCGVRNKQTHNSVQRMSTYISINDVCAQSYWYAKLLGLPSKTNVMRPYIIFTDDSAHQIVM
jgi:hypothetical protein